MGSNTNWRQRYFRLVEWIYAAFWDQRWKLNCWKTIEYETFGLHKKCFFSYSSFVLTIFHLNGSSSLWIYGPQPLSTTRTNTHSSLLYRNLKKKKEKLLFSKAVYHFIESLEPLCESTALKTRWNELSRFM